MTRSKSINSLILGPGVTLAGTGATLTINASNLMFVGSGSSTISVSNLNTVGGSIFVDTGMTATISSGVFAGNIQGELGKLILTGDNHTPGVINVNEGVLNIQRSTAIWSPAGTTTVRANASLELQQTSFGPIVIGLEPIAVDGVGSVAGMLGVGALRDPCGQQLHRGQCHHFGAQREPSWPLRRLRRRWPREL